MLVEPERGTDRARGLTLKNARRRCADGEDARRGVQRACSLFPDGIPLGVHVMVRDAFDLYRQEGADSDMQGYVCVGNSREELRM